MHRVIYADVLVVINIYITWILLKSTAVLSKEKTDSLRLFVSSFLGGAYSLTVLFPDRIQTLLSFFRIAAAILFVFVAFGFKSAGRFLRLNLCFFLCSFIFAGIILALWYFVSPQGMYFNGSVVYFDIDIMTLVVLTVICYAFLHLFDLVFKNRAPVNIVFLCTLFYAGESVSFRAFLDTGNRLTDYFTGNPVLILSKNLFYSRYEKQYADEASDLKNKLRFIFCDTLGGGELLCAFTPESVHIRGADYDFVTSQVTVALTDKKLLAGEYDAILPVGLFNNIRKGDTENERLKAFTAENQSTDI